jgi:hypothetical protein
MVTLVLPHPVEIDFCTSVRHVLNYYVQRNYENRQHVNSKPEKPHETTTLTDCAMGLDHVAGYSAAAATGASKGSLHTIVIDMFTSL